MFYRMATWLRMVRFLSLPNFSNQIIANVRTIPATVDAATKERENVFKKPLLINGL